MILCEDRFVNSTHVGRSLYMDELELPATLYTTASNRPAWHELRIDEDTRQPMFVAVDEGSAADGAAT